jgi:hypothetical protein
MYPIAPGSAPDQYHQITSLLLSSLGKVLRQEPKCSTEDKWIGNIPFVEEYSTVKGRNS